MARENTSFWPKPKSLSLDEVAALTGASLLRAGEGARQIDRVAPLESAGPGDLAFFDNPKYLDHLLACRATACLVAARHKEKVPAAAALLVADQPGRAVVKLLAALFPTSLRPRGFFAAEAGISERATVHAHARLERDVTIEPGATIAAEAEIGEGSVVGANAVIGPGVKIGRHCAIGANTVIQHALIGNRVVIHPGAAIGQDGFGYVMGPKGHAKAPQIGRVIIQDDVEIGANTAIDRGAIRDTVIGEGTKIDNLVQIGHNVVIGRHCVVTGQVGIAGSATLRDFVAIGGQSGVIGHVVIGEGAQIAAASNVATDVPPGARWGGTPAKPVREWLREITVVKQLAERGGTSQKASEE
jgi:UDP-3-O-[3-hydroxymyristoyl] glucosamine N-acyltransferase